jgi:hypothetical protein
MIQAIFNTDEEILLIKVVNKLVNCTYVILRKFIQIYLLINIEIHARFLVSLTGLTIFHPRETLPNFTTY